MEPLRKLERIFAVHYAKLPHLPLGFRDWLAKNIWWLTLIGVAFGILGIFGIFSILALAGVGFALGGAAVGGAIGATAGAALGVFFLVSALLSLALYIAEVILFAMAFNPLKSLKHRGWELLFLVVVLNAAVSIVSGVLSFNLVGIVIGLVLAGIGAYFLFEIREYFGASVVVKGKAPAAKKVKA